MNLLEQLDDGNVVPTVYSTFLYDAVGNQVQANSERFFEWDAADQLKFFKIDAGGASKEAHYLYAGGQRLKKFVRFANGSAEVTVYIDGVYEHRYTKDSGGTLTEEQTQLHVMDGRSSIATLRLGDAMGETVDDVYYTLEDPRTRSRYLTVPSRRSREVSSSANARMR